MKKWVGILCLLVISLVSCEWIEDDEWDIEGTVITDSGQPLNNVYVEVRRPGYWTSDNTDSNGDYTCHLTTADTYSITPTLDGYYFEPETREVTLTTSNYLVSGQDFNATAFHHIQGTVLYRADRPVNRV